MNSVESLQAHYPGAGAWSFGDSPAMADELAELVRQGRKRATCCSLVAWLAESAPPTVGSYHIILNGQQQPVCVIRVISQRLVKFSDVTAEFASKEGEGDLSLEYWRSEHEAFFTREGTFSADMELVAEEFQLIAAL